jgi:hypothetical protein
VSDLENVPVIIVVVMILVLVHVVVFVMISAMVTLHFPIVAVTRLG